MRKVTKLLALTIVLLLALTGCKEITVDLTADGNTVVAEYKGGTILKSEALPEYQMVEQVYIGSGYEEALKDKQTLLDLKTEILEYMVRERILNAKAEEFGVSEIPEADRIQVIKDATEEYNQMVAIYGPSFATEGMSDEEARTAAINGLANTYGYTEQTGINAALVEYKEKMFSDYVTKDVTVSDDDIRTIYEERVAEDKLTYTDDPGAYDSAVAYGGEPMWAPEGVRMVKHILITPSDATSNEQYDIEDEIAAVELAIDDLTGTSDEDEDEDDAGLELIDDEPTEEGEGDAPVEAAVGGATLDNTGDEPVVTQPDATANPQTEDEALEANITETDSPEPAEPASADEVVDLDADAQTDAADEDATEAEDFEPTTEEIDYSTFTLEELEAKKAELEQKKAEIDARAKAEIEPIVTEVLAKLAAGEDFDALMAEYGNDPGMQAEPTMTTGYPVSAASTIWDSLFADGAMAIAEVGGVSEPIYTSFGCHIIRYVSDVTPGPVDFDSVKESLRDEALETKKEEFHDAEVQKWMDEAEIKLYPEKL